MAALACFFPARAAAAAGAGSDAPQEKETIGDLVRQLGDPSWEARDRAQTALVARGLEGVRQLTEAARSRDPEIAERAKQVLALVDPLTVRVRIARMALDSPSRIAAVIEGEGSDSSEILLSQRADPAAAAPTVVVRSRQVSDSGVQLTVEEIHGPSASATSLHAPFRSAGTFSILKRGEDATYRQIGCHLERQRRPFLLLMQWWSRRPSEPAGSGAKSPAADMESVVRELTRQADEGSGIEPRLTAIEVLGLIGHSGSEAPLAAALEEPALRTVALCGLARLGRPDAVAGLRQLVSVAIEDEIPASEPAAGVEEKETEPEKVRPRASDRTPPFDERAESGAAPARPSESAEHRWLTQAALVLVQGGDAVGFHYLCDRLAAIGPLDMHTVLATLADHLEKAPPEFSSRILGKLGTPDLLLQLPWEDPEVEHSLAKFAAGAGDLAPDGTLGKLLIGLARALYDSSRGGVYGTSRPRTFSRLWQRLTAGKAPPELRRRILEEVLGGSPLPQQLMETVNWIVANHPAETVPDREFGKLIDGVRTILQRTDSGYSSYARSALLEIARGLELGEQQIPGLVRILADAVRQPHQPYAQELLSEAERITGEVLRRPQRPIPAPGKAPRPAPTQEENPADQLLRWLEKPDSASAAFARLREARNGKAHGDPLEYYEFLILSPEKPLRGAASRQAAELSRPAPSGPPVVLSAIRQEVTPGVRFAITDRWGNRIFHRIDRDPTVATPRYRLDGELYLDLDFPAIFSRRDFEVRSTQCETSDSRLEPVTQPLQESLQRVGYLSARAEVAAPPDLEGDTGAIWRQFLDRFVGWLAGGPDRVARALYIIGQLQIKEAGPLLREELARTSRLDIAIKLFEMGDPGGEEFLRREMQAALPARRLQAARTLAQGCDTEGIREIVRLCRSGHKEILANAYSLVAALDSYMSHCSPSVADRTEALGALVENLHLVQFQPWGFRILRREAGSDFGYEDAQRLASNAAQSQAKEEAVRKARAWWESRKPPR